ncbi:MAG: hypothetical protein ABF876_17395 [Acetobacter aceti]
MANVLYTYKVVIQIQPGTNQETTIQADSQYNAQKIAEMQYGKENIISLYQMH